jgi:hypothetical protein
MPPRNLPAFPLPSGFRLSLGQRLLAATCLVVPLWAAVIWAVDEPQFRNDRQNRDPDVTLGYDRHPAVHHLNGEVAPARCWR